MTPSYLFYDIETTGLSKCFDQVIQFAAIRTDVDLNEIDRHEIFVKLNPDTVPSPGAVITHQLGMQQLQQGSNEIVAIEQIHQLLNTPGTISVGYNSLGFDDEFLRFSFYRNLLPPYTHQYANQCGRMDIYPMTVMYYLYNTSAINWPENNGKPSLKLADLNAANELATGDAHNAMVDVEVTLALAKKLKSHDDMWNYVCGYFDKQQDTARFAKLPLAFDHYRIGLMVNGSFAADSHFQHPVLMLGQHQYYKNQTLWLRLDLATLTTTTAESVADTPWVIRKKPGEPGLILPTHERFMKHIDPQRNELMQTNVQWLQAHPDILTAITEYHQQYKYPAVADIDADAALYEFGFPTPNEQRLCERFHQLPVTEKADIINQLSNPILRQHCIRIMGRHYPDQLPEPYRADFQGYLAKLSQNQALFDYKGGQRLTPQHALQEIKQLKKDTTLSQRQQTLLQELEDTIANQFQQQTI